MQSTYHYKHLFHFVLLSLFILISYSNTYNSDWHLDDIPNIVENPKIHLQNFNWQNVSEILNFYRSSRPISYISFALNYATSGLDTTSYHIVNIFIHTISSIFVYLVFLQTLYLLQRNKRYQPAFFSVHDIALLGAVLWAIHPIHTQAVTYIVQRMTSMAGMFYMIAMYCYLVFRLKTDNRKFLFLFLAAFFWAGGVLTKENVILLPIILFGYEIAFFDEKFNFRKKLAIFGVVALLVVCLAFYVTGGNFLDIVNYSYTYRPFTMWERLITEPIILLRYLFLILYPSPDFLIFDPDIQASVGLLQPPITILGDFLVILLFIFSLMNLRRFPILCFAIFYFFVNHAIESSFIGLELYFEHRNYIPSIFIYFVLSYYFIRVIEFYNNKSYIKILLCISMTFVLTSEANATFLRNDIWKTNISLLENNIEKAPLNMRSWFNLGAIHIREKKFKEANYYLFQAEKLYEIYPYRYQDNWISLLYYNFGILELHTNNTDKAIKYLVKSIEINPDAIKWSSHFNLGVLYFEDGQFEKSEESLQNALKRGNNLPDIYNVLGRVLYENNKVDEAVEIFEKGLSIKYMPELTLNLIAAYIKKGNLQKAKQALFSMPYNKNYLEYLLYSAYLYTGEDRDKSLNAVAAKFLLTKSDIYAWVDEITSNKFAAIIYPDMQELHEPLINKYKGMFVKDIASKINVIDNMSCQK